MPRPSRLWRVTPRLRGPRSGCRRPRTAPTPTKVAAVLAALHGGDGAAALVPPATPVDGWPPNVAAAALNTRAAVLLHLADRTSSDADAARALIRQALVALDRAAERAVAAAAGYRKAAAIQLNKASALLRLARRSEGDRALAHSEAAIANLQLCLSDMAADSRWNTLRGSALLTMARAMALQARLGRARRVDGATGCLATGRRGISGG